MVRTFNAGALLLAGALLAAGCDNTIDNPTGPAPTPEMKTSTFEGSINVNGAATHTFDVSANGTVTASLTEILPDPAVAVGFALGTWNGTNCQLVITKDDAIQGQALIGNSSGVGTLCVRIHDTGRLTARLTYKVTVNHP
ncbi:MAG TPA: hypothetical protein VM364_01450 [Vicinamibacterales bacterium]|nr:hypothetical protein [Vicinamibacterales bacterium]